MNNFFSYIIVGGGVAGLYTAYRLIENNISPHKILIIEQEGNCGGKLKGAKTPNGTINLGAGRFNHREHPLLHRLISKLKLTTKPHLPFNPEQPKWLAYEFIKDLSYKCQQKSNNSSITFVNFIKSTLGANHLTELEYSGYATLLNPKLSANEAFRIILQHPEFAPAGENYWAEINAGFNAITNIITKLLLNKGLTILTEHKVNQVIKNHQYFQVHIDGMDKLQSEHLIAASPNLEYLASLNLDSSSSLDLINLTTAIEAIPLFKAFLGFDNIWWQNLLLTANSQCTMLLLTNNNKLGKIFLERNKPIIWIYNDGSVANYWQQAANTEDFLKVIMGELNNSIDHTASEIPHPTWFNHKYWPQGAEFTISHQEQQIQQTRLNLSQNYQLHLVSSCYSSRNGWVEGALENVEELLKNMEKVKLVQYA